MALPRVDVVLEGNGSAGALALADRQVLVERSGSLDGRRVCARGLVNIVHAAVGSDLGLLSV